MKVHPAAVNRLPRRKRVRSFDYFERETRRASMQAARESREASAWTPAWRGGRGEGGREDGATRAARRKERTAVRRGWRRRRRLPGCTVRSVTLTSRYEASSLRIFLADPPAAMTSSSLSLCQSVSRDELLVIRGQSRGSIIARMNIQGLGAAGWGGA
jgi:hypothetical protein